MDRAPVPADAPPSVSLAALRRFVADAAKRLRAHDLAVLLDPTCPHDAQLLSALERWSFGDHA